MGLPLVGKRENSFRETQDNILTDIVPTSQPLIDLLMALSFLQESLDNYPIHLFYYTLSNEENISHKKTLILLKLQSHLKLFVDVKKITALLKLQLPPLLCTYFILLILRGLRMQLQIFVIPLSHISIENYLITKKMHSKSEV